MTQWGLDALFNPSKRHMDEEKARLQSTREEVGDASGGRRIDLASGRVRISRPDKNSSPPLAGDDPADGTGVDPSGGPADEDPSPAGSVRAVRTDALADADPADAEPAPDSPTAADPEPGT